MHELFCLLPILCSDNADRMIPATQVRENDEPRSHILSPDAKALQIFILRALRALRGDSFFLSNTSPLNRKPSMAQPSATSDAVGPPPCLGASVRETRIQSVGTPKESGTAAVREGIQLSREDGCPGFHFPPVLPRGLRFARLPSDGRTRQTRQTRRTRRTVGQSDEAANCRPTTKLRRSPDYAAFHLLTSVATNSVVNRRSPPLNPSPLNSEPAIAPSRTGTPNESEIRSCARKAVPRSSISFSSTFGLGGFSDLADKPG